MTQKVVTNDEADTGANNCFAIFGTFGRYVTNLRGTFVQWWASLHDVVTALQISRYSFPLKR
jgi:hypothetical protein